MSNNNNPGVITEQGFVTGGGLGFKPLTEAEKKQIEKDLEKKDK